MPASRSREMSPDCAARPRLEGAAPCSLAFSPKAVVLQLRAVGGRGALEGQEAEQLLPAELSRPTLRRQMRN